MSKTIAIERGDSSKNSPDTPDFLIREEKQDGIIKVRPRFEFPLNSIFSNMTKQEKIELLKKSKEDQIDELKELFKDDFLTRPIEYQRGILKKLTYNNSQYDDLTGLHSLNGNRYAVNYIYRLRRLKDVSTKKILTMHDFTLDTDSS